MSSQAQQAREALGARLRELRRDAGLTGRALSSAVGWQLSKVSKIEHGKQTPTEADIRVWCQHCGADADVADLVATVRAVEAMWMEWRRILHSGTRRRQRTSIGLYEKARQIRVYEPSVIWGTLQTPEYAAAVLRTGVDFHQIPDDVEAGVAARMERQQTLYRGDRRFSALLGEQALYTRVGGTEVMAAQLDRLLVAMAVPRLSLGIIPLAGPAEHGVLPGEGFVMFDDQVVMVETVSAELTITQPREIALYSKAFMLLQKSAVYGRDARTLIARARSTLY
ncbi:helix-turn-helix protein [Murinocardiopsis flavida]|uniref:Helix-turn-helix protein n=1 Tax=Murinocardiopsis flavida TaxID=645275 RepID=A0A2P8DHA0_9ACTN|nr:helix-turn-helix transcriptional regulator [Murinocardiopsis flavida]PSK96588.1 helix-turn-helix protein [Murinocardiopsis flavida]